MPPGNIVFRGYKMGTWRNTNGIKQHSIGLGLRNSVEQCSKRKEKASKQDKF